MTVRGLTWGYVWGYFLAVTEDAELRTVCENAVQGSQQLQVAACLKQCLACVEREPLSAYVRFYCTVDDVAIDALRMQSASSIDTTILEINSTLIMSGTYRIKITKQAHTTHKMSHQRVYDLSGNCIINMHCNIYR